MRASHASRSSRVGKIFLFFRIVISFDVSENPAHSDADVGERAHHLEHLSTVDALLFVHPNRVPGVWPGRKTAAAATPFSAQDSASKVKLPNWEPT